VKRKIKYAVFDDVEQLVVVLEDGSIATAHHNEEFIIVDWYSLPLPKEFNDDNIRETIWEYLDSGRRFYKFFPHKQEIDDEIIKFMLDSLSGYVEYEKDEEVDCFCEEDLKIFLKRCNYIK